MRKSRPGSKGRLTAPNFDQINEAAKANTQVFLDRLFSNRKGNRKTVRREFKQKDRTFVKLDVNGYNCKWHDYATGDMGDNPISLFSHAVGIPQNEAARVVARIVGIEAGTSRS